MITIKENIYIKDNVFQRHNKKTAKCTSCDRDLLFFDIAPITCCYCNTLLLNMQKMISEQNYRVDYHFGVLNL